MTCSQFVKSKMPEARCFRREGDDVWFVTKSNEHEVGFATGLTGAEAWQVAARQLGFYDEPKVALDEQVGDAAKPEAVNHPDHYNASPIECIDAIEAALTPEEFRGFIKGNVLKYVWREKHKAGDQDLAKAAWYLNRLKK